MSYKLNIIALIFFLGLHFSKAQNKEGLILKTPADWRYEKIDLPLDFAPSFNYKGFEELRFAPGMFNTNAEKYFSYAFVIAINEDVKFSKRKIKQFLYSYYRGLSQTVANSKKIEIDTSTITVSLKRKKKIYNGKVLYLDTFNSGEKVALNITIEVINNKLTNATYIIGLVSPKSRGNAIWNELYAIRNQLTF